MKKTKVIALSLAIVASFIVAHTYATARQTAQQPPKGFVDETVIMSMIERGQPSEAYTLKVLAPLIGEWEYSAAFWSTPDADPAYASGTATNEMIMGDRFLSSKILGSLNIAGHNVPITRTDTIGYDNMKKSFTSVQIDSISTEMVVGHGQYDAEQNTLNETGTFTDHLTGKEKKFRATLAFIDTDKYKRTVFSTDEAGKEMKLMEFEYTRKR
ncbi:MAG: DUF1579 family protein [Alphaproteobacteria bacterium]|nr:DUF1579 family protein [Alphaproteobacteria bacterium]